jgi:hypothetical protein
VKGAVQTVEISALYNVLQRATTCYNVLHKCYNVLQRATQVLQRATKSSMSHFEVAVAQLESIIRGERGHCALLGLRYVPKLTVEVCDICKGQTALETTHWYKAGPYTHYGRGAHRPHNCFGMGPMCECCTWYAECRECKCGVMGEEDLTPQCTPHPLLCPQGDRDEDYVAWYPQFHPERYQPLTTLVDTHVAPLLLHVAVPVEYITAWRHDPPYLEASATWLPEKPSTSTKPINLPPLASQEEIECYKRIALLRNLRSTANRVALDVLH